MAEDEVRAEADKPDFVADVDSLVARLEALETGASSVLLYAAPFAEREFEGLCGRLNLYREKLAGMRRPLIFWIPSGLLPLFTRSVPDFDSWVMLRLDLTEIVRPAGPAPEMTWSGENRLLPAEARGIAERLAGQARAAVPREEALVAAGGAVSVLIAAGLFAEARALAEEFLGVLATTELGTTTGMEAELALREAEGRWTRQERVAAFGRWVARLDTAADSIEGIRARLKLAQAQFDAGDLEGARRVQEEVLATSRQWLGPSHPETLTGMNNLAMTLYAQGDLQSARQLQEEVLAIRRRLLGEEHPETIESMNNLAATLQAQGDLEGARQIQEQVWAMRRRLFGEKHPDTLTSMNNLATNLNAQGDLEGARQLHEQVLEVRRHMLGEEHPDTLTSMNNLALTLAAQPDLPAARQLQARVLAVTRCQLGEEHPDTLGAMLNLAHILYDGDDLAGARELQEQVVAASRRALGDEHPFTLRSMNNLAVTLEAQRDLTGAREILEQVLDAAWRRLGREHPDTVGAAWNLFKIVEALQDSAAATKLFRGILAPLLQRDPETMPADLRRIQQQLRAMVGSGQSKSETNPKPDFVNHPKHG